MPEKRYFVYLDRLRSGIDLLTVFQDYEYGPLGMVWGTIQDKSTSNNNVKLFTVYGSFVQPSKRRQGVRTAVNNYLFDEMGIDVICSFVGSDEGGKEFMERSGYQVSEDTGYWYLHKPTKETVSIP